MDEPLLAYIALVAFNFAPVGWAFCNGQLLSIIEHDVLFTLMGTTYGGDGVTTFALPDLRGRVPIHNGQGPGLSPYILGQRSGAEEINLNLNQIASHDHLPQCTTEPGNSAGPGGAIWASTSGDNLYAASAPGAAMAVQAIGSVGGGQPHENRQPYLGLNYIIALNGLFPTQN
jgi:microcystin-dependent protein